MFRTLKALFLVLSFAVAPAYARSITAAEAASHVDQRATVCGKIAGVHTAYRSAGQPTFIDLDRAYPNEVFTAVIWGRDRAAVGTVSAVGHNVCFTGTISSYRGVPQIVLHGRGDWSSSANDSHSVQLSNNRHYVNSDGHSVHSPAHASGGVPTGATAVCGDGTYSFSQHHRGTCSHHGGVARWL